MSDLIQKHTVATEETAKALGSGNLDVLGTPALVAIMENAAKNCLGLELAEQEDSVGVNIQVDHLKASLVGEVLRVEARMTERSERKAEFEIKVFDSSEALVGRAGHTRVIIDPVRFMHKLQDKK